MPCKAILKRLMCAADEDPTSDEATERSLCSAIAYLELELELIHTQMAKKPKFELGPILSRKLWEREGSGRRVAHRKVRVKMGFWVQGKIQGLSSSLVCLCFGSWVGAQSNSNSN